MLAELVVTVFLYLAIFAMAAVAFGLWMVVAVIRGIVRTVRGALSPPVPRAALWDVRRICTRRNCLAANPPGARFCRRCGEELA